MPRRNIYILLIVIGISLICYQRSDSERRSRYGRMFATYSRVMREIEENFIKEVDPIDVFDAGLAGMADALDDPHTKYVPPEEFPQLRQELSQEFGGIGINVDWDEKHKTLKVASPMVGTPAFEAGLQAGDLILEVDGASIVGKPADEAIVKIKGKPGTTVRLKVLHEGQSEPREYTITRAEIKAPGVVGDRYLPSGKWDFMLEGHDGIAYIRVLRFGERTVAELTEALERAKAQGMKGLVLDLRNNPGGLLNVAVEVADLFIEEGVIVSIRDRKGRERSKDLGAAADPAEDFQAEVDGTYSGFPMAVLINGFSASASEIVAACLQDHHRAVIVGERSFGKGSVQNVIGLDNNRSALKLTVATYWRPSGKNIHRLPGAGEEAEWGVRPDEGYEIKLDTEARRKLRDHRRERDVLRPDGKVPPLKLDLDPHLKRAVEYVTGAAE